MFATLRMSLGPVPSILLVLPAWTRQRYNSHTWCAVQQAQVRVIAQTDNVAGVRIPKFEQRNTGGESKMGLTGLGKGGQQVQQCRKVCRQPSRQKAKRHLYSECHCPATMCNVTRTRQLLQSLPGCCSCMRDLIWTQAWSVAVLQNMCISAGYTTQLDVIARSAGPWCEDGYLPVQAYLKAVELLIELASLQTAFLTLDEAIKTTNRRVNALDNVVRPRLENTIAYIKVS